MTMEIKITNADQQRVAEVREREVDVTSQTGQAARESKTRLGPGESRSFWIHAAKTLLITEDPNG